MIIAGPCSINKNNIEQLEEIIKCKVDGIRFVGLKSRTSYSSNKEEIGIDNDIYQENKNILLSTRSFNQLKIYPSINIANDISKKYPKIIICTEIIDPLLQLPVWEKYFKGNLFIWNPSVNQLGFNIQTMSEYLLRNESWFMGIKNGKWLGKSGLNTWEGLTTYITGVEKIKHRIYLIHRGFDLERNISNNRYRNIPKHNLAKEISKKTGLKLLFDPSHSLGKKLRGNIVKESIKIMKDKEYSGLLIEVGHSNTDTHQHITIQKLKEILGSPS